MNVFKRVFQILKKPSIFHILTITALMIVAKGFGFIRNALLYADRNYADVFSNPQRIQSSLVAILIAGTLITTFTPTGTKIENRDGLLGGNKALSEYFKVQFWIVLQFFSLVSILVFVFNEQLLRLTNKPELLAKIQELGYYGEFVNSGKVLAFGVLFFAINSLLVSYLSIKNSFVLTSLTGIITSVFTVFAVLFFAPLFAFYANLFLVIGLAISCLVLFFGAQKYGLGFEGWGYASFLKNINKYKVDILSDYKSLWPRLFLIPIPTFAILVLNREYTDLGTMTTFETADNIQSIFTAFVVAVGMVLLPKLSKTLYTKSDKAFKTQINNYLSKIIPLSVAGFVITFFVGEYILRLMKILRGNFTFTEQDMSAVSLVRILAITLIFTSINEVLVKYYLIKTKIKYLIVGNFIALLIVLSFVLISKQTLKLAPELSVSWSLVLAFGFTSIWYYLGLFLNKD